MGMEMELRSWVWMSGATLLACYFVVNIFGRRVNEWYYDFKLGRKHRLLPPGDMGWPLIGKTWFFIKHLRSGNAHPDLFLNDLVSKYGKAGMYKTHLFMNPGIVVYTLEECRKVFSDDNKFKLGYPQTTLTVTQSPMNDVSSEEHKRFRRLVAAPVMGYNALAKFVDIMEDNVIESLEGMARRSTKQPVMAFKETMALSFRVIVHIFIGSYHHRDTIKQIEDLFRAVDDALFSWPINFPGFTYHKALKNRKKVEEIVQSIVEDRKVMRKNSSEVTEKKDLVDILLEVEDVNGKKLKGEDIVNMLIVFLLAGHVSTATVTMWSMIYLSKNPLAFNKAKEEQEEILKSRPPSQKHLSIEEIKKMVYLTKVINEVIRVTEWGVPFFREATMDVAINGYIIPKGWRVFIWPRGCHRSSEYFPNPEDFNPSRWDEDDDFTKGGAFFPFGVGTRMCPRRDLTKIEMLIFLHHFVRNYKFEQINPECPVSYVPVPVPKDQCLARVIKVSME